MRAVVWAIFGRNSSFGLFSRHVYPSNEGFNIHYMDCVRVTNRWDSMPLHSRESLTFITPMAEIFPEDFPRFSWFLPISSEFCRVFPNLATNHRLNSHSLLIIHSLGHKIPLFMCSRRGLGIVPPVALPFSPFRHPPSSFRLSVAAKPLGVVSHADCHSLFIPGMTSWGSAFRRYLRPKPELQQKRLCGNATLATPSRNRRPSSTERRAAIQLALGSLHRGRVCFHQIVKERKLYTYKYD